MRNRKRISQFPADVDVDSSAFSINLPSPEGLTDNQVKAIELLAVWKKQTPDEFCADATFKAIEQEFIELRAAAGGEVENAAEQAWAAEFFDRVEALMGLPKEELQMARKVHGLPPRASGKGGTQ